MALLLISQSFAAGAEDLLPSGWHLSQLSKGNNIEADLSGAGHMERAVLVTDGDHSSVVAFIYGPDGMDPLKLFDTVHDPRTLTLKLAPPGEYRTACAKGYLGCQNDEPESVVLDRPTLSFSDENVEILFVLTKGAVKRIWLSD
ncbi:MAG TPA: hypothetical protein VM689_23560 [Aliidongia sp.]|nr:hypothetical protein [Aliidongia sp.]